jgi:peptidyl-prolyl cis-trans isomerase C
LQADIAQQPCGSTSVAKAYFDAHTRDFTQDCVSLISINDENLANSIVAQTRAGGDFAALAKQYSTDAQTASAGGDAGCHYPAEFPPTIAPTVQGTQVGAVTDPISDNAGGFVIIKVNDRKPAAFEDVSSDAGRLAARDQSVELGAWLEHALTDASVTVDPRFGTFDPSTGSIKPPPVDNGASNSSSSGSEAPPESTP